MKEKNTKKLEKVWSEITAKAWTDEKFKDQLLKNPNKVLEDHGLDTDGKQFKILEDTKSLTHFSLLTEPKGNPSKKECCDSCNHYWDLKKH